ncbi:MAG: hypothetical protein AAFR17_12395 [Pseudomonadota bacterium]
MKDAANETMASPAELTVMKLAYDAVTKTPDPWISQADLTDGRTFPRGAGAELWAAALLLPDGVLEWSLYGDRFMLSAEFAQAMLAGEGQA